MLNNLFEKIPKNLSDEVFDTLMESDGMKLEKIVSLGQKTPEGKWLIQERSEWVILLKGAAKLSFKDTDSIIDLSPGDYLNIPAQRAHRVEWTDPKQKTIWLALHYDAE